MHEIENNTDLFWRCFFSLIPFLLHFSLASLINKQWFQYRLTLTVYTLKLSFLAFSPFPLSFYFSQNLIDRLWIYESGDLENTKKREERELCLLSFVAHLGFCAHFELLSVIQSHDQRALCHFTPSLNESKSSETLGKSCASSPLSWFHNWATKNFVWEALSLSLSLSKWHKQSFFGLYAKSLRLKQFSLKIIIIIMVWMPLPI